MTGKLKIFIVDDHEFYRKGVAFSVNRLRYTEVVGEAANGVEFLDKIENNRPDIVLMDIKMPLMDGIEATREATRKYPGLKVVALSMFGEEEYLESMLEAGIQGFLLKNISKDGLDRALQVIAQDKQYFSEELIPHFTNNYLKKKEADPAAQLTNREVEILRLVADGMTNQEIANKLCISVRTVTNHRANMNSKTGSKNTAGLLSFALKNNLVEL